MIMYACNSISLVTANSTIMHLQVSDIERYVYGSRPLSYRRTIWGFSTGCNINRQLFTSQWTDTSLFTEYCIFLIPVASNSVSAALKGLT